MALDVSILIPTHNRPDMLREAVRSALTQTYANLEVVVMDDAGSDRTPLVCAGFSSYQNLRYIRNERTLGIVGNWRAGIAAAKGRFFCLLHDDDTLEPRFVEELVAPLLESDTRIMSFSDHWVMDTSGRRLASASDETSRRFKRHVLPPGPVCDFATCGLVDHSIPVGASMFRRKPLSPECLDDAAAGAADMWLIYRCVKAGGSAFYVPQRLMNYRSHGGGMSVSAPLAMASGHVFRNRQILRDPGLAAIHPRIREELFVAITNCGLALLAAGRTREAREMLEEAIRTHITLRLLIAYVLSYCGSAGTGALRFWRA